MNAYPRLVLVGLVLAAAGCESDGPPTVRYGQEGCARCRMIVNDDRFAAALVLPNGDTHKFDDVCCLVDYLAEHKEAPKALWIRGYQSGQWHDAGQAFFVHGPKLQTPMGSGLAAVPTREDADKLAAELSGPVLRFDELAAFLDKHAQADK